jgi:hypothetical protein
MKIFRALALQKVFSAQKRGLHINKALINQFYISKPFGRSFKIKS